MKPVLYVAGTPIGNRKDASQRLIEMLTTADFIICEDTRVTRKLIAVLGVRTRGRLISCPAFREKTAADSIVRMVKKGQTLLLSDAGMPGVCDPGALIVSRCIDEGIEVVSVPGPSAVSAALSLSGFACGRYVFEGFVPRKRKDILELAHRVKNADCPSVMFTSPFRLAKDLKVFCEIVPDRRACICREMTKMHEEVLRGTTAELCELIETGVRGEIVLIFDANRCN